MASPSHGTTNLPRKDTDPASADLARLRTLLLAPERRQLERIQKQVDSLVVDEKSVGRILPNAIVLRSKQDSQLAKSLSPIIEEGFLTFHSKIFPRKSLMRFLRSCLQRFVRPS